MKRVAAVLVSSISALLAALSYAPTASADSFSVFVGYADTLRASGFFPAPWIGDSGIVAAESGLQTFDSGAIRIDNTGATPITIHNMTVSLNGGSGPVYTLWSDLTIGAGDKGIYAQTASFNFDTSDSGFLPSPIGIDGSHPLGGCTNPGALTLAQQAMCLSDFPIISFQENGNPAVSFHDTGHVLDTFGYDFIAGSSDGNESINWNTIGSKVSRGGSVPEPSSILLLAAGLLAAGFVRRQRR